VATIFLSHVVRSVSALESFLVDIDENFATIAYILEFEKKERGRKRICGVDFPLQEDRDM